MSRAAAIGEPLRIYGYRLAGALLQSDRAEAVRAWHGLPDDVAVVLLTGTAAEWLADELELRPAILPVMLPDPAWPVGKPGSAEVPL